MKIAVLDIETTGLVPYSGSIVEIGIVELNLDTGDIATLMDTKVLEIGRQIDKNAWIFQNSDLTIEEVMKAPSLDSLRNKIQAILDEYPVAAFNKQFDFGFLKARRFNIPKELPCIMITATEPCKIYKGGRLKWPTAQEAYRFFVDKAYVEKHRAADDAADEARILFSMYNQGLYPIE